MVPFAKIAASTDQLPKFSLHGSGDTPPADTLRHKSTPNVALTQF